MKKFAAGSTELGMLARRIFMNLLCKTMVLDYNDIDLVTINLKYDRTKHVGGLLGFDHFATVIV